MAKRPRTRDELEALLDRQKKFLISSAEAFDAGDEDEAVRLATTIRVLVHDTKASHSLLGMLDRKAKANFLDTAFPVTAGSMTAHGGLVTLNVGKSSKYAAPLDGVVKARRVTFDDWWNSPVFIAANGASMSRKDLILTAANQDGGAHVDPKIDEDYDALASGEFMGWKTRHDDVDFIPGPERAAVRQIAHEMLKNLDTKYRKFPDISDAGIIVGASSLVMGVPPESRPLPPGTKKPGRNDPCPCGSGRKFKQCHLRTSFGGIGGGL